MRVSIIEGDPGFVIDPISYRVQVDGVEVAAVTADEEAGEAWVWDTTSGEPKTRLVRGRVVIERWEADDVDHPENTVGFRDDDGFWAWCPPDSASYPRAQSRATHLWDRESRTWVSLRSLVRH